MLDQNPLSRAWAALTTHTPLHTLVYAIVGVYLARFVYTTFLYARFFSPLRKMPGPSYGHWLLGRLPEVVTGEAGSAVTAWTEQYGRSIRFMGMLGVERVCFLNYKDLKQILVDEPYRFPKPKWAAHLLGVTAGYGLLTLENAEHSALRRFMNPAFAFKYLEMQFPLYLGPVNGLIEIYKDKLKEAGDPEEGTVIELTHGVNACLLDIICSTAFGYETDHLHNPHEPLGESYETLVNLQNGFNMGRIIAILGLPFGPQVVQWAVKQEWTGKGAMALVHKLGLGKGFSELGLFLTHMYRVNKISREMLETKLAEAKKLREAGQTDLDSGKIDILSLLAKASLDENSPYKMDQKLLEAQVLTFLGAGHETTASGMAWAMWELANHQDVQAKLRAECQEILSVSAEPTYAQIKDAKYLHNFVMEVMRLRPPTPQTARVASVDSTIGGRFIPRGTEIYIPNLTINTQKDVWGDDAKEFRPERWDDLPKEYNSSMSLLTFIVGAHSCPGRNMAVHELKVLCCMMVANFELHKTSPDQTVKSVAAITWKPDGGLSLRLKRTTWSS